MVLLDFPLQLDRRFRGRVPPVGSRPVAKMTADVSLAATRSIRASSKKSFFASWTVSMTFLNLGSALRHAAGMKGLSPTRRHALATLN